MSAEIIIIPMEVWQGILLVCGGIITIGGAVAVIQKLLKSAKKPQANIKKDIGCIKKTLLDHDRFFKNDKESIEDITKGQEIMFKSHLALISHAIDGNDINQLKKVKSELQTFLIEN